MKRDWRGMGGVLLVGLMTLTSGCDESFAELVVVVNTDLAVPSEAERVRLTITSGEERVEREVVLGEGASRRSLSIFTRSGDTVPISIVAEALSAEAEEPRLRRTYQTELRPGPSRTLAVNLLRGCLPGEFREKCFGHRCVNDGLPCDEVRVVAEELGSLLCEDGSLCLPGLESCNQQDDDRDGEVDEGFQTASGGGEEAPPEEICDGVDNDCDPGTDEGSGECDFEVERCAVGLDGGYACRGIERYRVESIEVPFVDACAEEEPQRFRVSSRGLVGTMPFDVPEDFFFYGERGGAFYVASDASLFFVQRTVAENAVADWLWDSGWGVSTTLTRPSLAGARPAVFGLWQALLPSAVCVHTDGEDLRVTWRDLRTAVSGTSSEEALSVTVVLRDTVGSQADLVEVHYQASDGSEASWVEALLETGVVGVAGPYSDCPAGTGGECRQGMCSSTGGACGHTEVGGMVRPTCLGEEGCERISGVRFTPAAPGVDD